MCDAAMRKGACSSHGHVVDVRFSRVPLSSERVAGMRAIAAGLVFIAAVGCSKKSTLTAAASKPARAPTEEVARIKADLAKALGRDWDLRVTTRQLAPGLEHGIYIFGNNKALPFKPPTPKGLRYAYVRLYLHPRTVSQTPSNTQTDGDILSTQIGETDTYRVYGGVVAPIGSGTILRSVCTALHVRMTSDSRGE
jgi:hypothetical protein